LAQAQACSPKQTTQPTLLHSQRMARFLLVAVLAAAPAHGALLRARAPDLGVGDLKDLAHLLPYHPRGQAEGAMKTRCVNFVNGLLEKSAYSPQAVGDVMPKCAWSKAECAALKKDLMGRLKKASKKGGKKEGKKDEKKDKKKTEKKDEKKDEKKEEKKEEKKAEKKKKKKGSLLQKRDAQPAGPEPDFLTEGGLDNSVYGWCDVMYNMMHKKAIAAEVKREEAQKKAQKKTEKKEEKKEGKKAEKKEEKKAEKKEKKTEKKEEKKEKKTEKKDAKKVEKKEAKKVEKKGDKKDVKKK